MMKKCIFVFTFILSGVACAIAASAATDWDKPVGRAASVSSTSVFPVNVTAESSTEASLATDGLRVEPLSEAQRAAFAKKLQNHDHERSRIRLEARLREELVTFGEIKEGLYAGVLVIEDGQVQLFEMIRLEDGQNRTWLANHERELTLDLLAKKATTAPDKLRYRVSGEIGIRDRRSGASLGRSYVRTDISLGDGVVASPIPVALQGEPRGPEVAGVLTLVGMLTANSDAAKAEATHRGICFFFFLSQPE